MLAWFGALALATDFELDMRLRGRIGEPYVGYSGVERQVPNRIRPAESVQTEVGGFTLTCSGRRRVVSVMLEYDVREFPEHPPTELECVVGGHRLVVHLIHDLELAHRSQDHPTLRSGSRGISRFRVGPGWPQGPGRLVDTAYRAIDVAKCRVEGELLVVEVVGEVAPGAHRCVVDGQPPIPVEILP